MSSSSRAWRPFQTGCRTVPTFNGGNLTPDLLRKKRPTWMANRERLRPEEARPCDRGDTSGRTGLECRDVPRGTSAID